MIKIAPSILSANFARLEEDIKAAENAGAHMLHIDVMDGHFVPNITIGCSVVKAVRKITRLPLDVHLMIENPDIFVKEFADAGADFLTVHCEASIHLHRTIQHIKQNNMKAGVAINPATPVLYLENILSDVDLALLMSVDPGFGGQEFIPFTIEKIKAVKKMTSKAGVTPLIEVDGGVKIENAKAIADAGADILVMGSAFFKSDNYSLTMETLNEILGNR
ncbi:MAG: ribulose-phosphate 3-epimerase [Nitrospira bacterium HGW-Nitrospira-1]|nr:MAG: ribulose-phosphate 3-epimerase [Nitrospira bacterium HGW-Nitrospira-1]